MIGEGWTLWESFPTVIGSEISCPLQQVPPFGVVTCWQLNFKVRYV
jgi:hypothetical protein